MSKILVVDDSPVMRDAIARVLGDKGYTVSTAEGGRAAWCTLYADLPDLIVLDLLMPEMSGVAFLRMLRAHHHWNEIPVLVVTALDNDEALVQDIRDLGVIDVICKGSDIIDLLLHHTDGLFHRHVEVTA